MSMIKFNGRYYSIMKFNVEYVKHYLEMYGIVYTIRGYFVKKDIKVFVEGIGLCERKLIKAVNHISEIKEYFLESGFSDVNMWWDIVKNMYKNKPKFLYKVTKII